MNERDRFSGRPRYDEPDMISSAYLRSNASYTDFLQKQHHGEPPRDYRGPPRYPQGHPREQEFREPPRSSWRNESTHLLPFPPRPDFREREPGWRNEPSWRASGSQPPRAESWVERRDRIAPPPGPEAQRFIAPPEIHRHIAPPHGMPHDFPQERWRGSPASANWRNERPEEPAPQRRRFDTPDRIIERPIRESSPRRSPPRRFSISPPRTTALEPIPRPEPSTEQVKIPKTDSPVRNRILPAQEVDRSNLSIPDSSSTTSEEPEVRSSWKHGPPRPREESWTLQYKRRVEAQKEAMKRNMARSSVHDIPAGPSAEQARLPERMKDDRLGREESPPRKFFFSQNDANGSREDDRQDYRDKDKYREDQDELRKYTETKTNGRLKDGESTINPSDFVEPIEQFNDDDDWNALGELLNDQSRKRPRPADEIIPSPVKTVPAPVPKPAPSDHPYYRKESSRVEAPRPQVSFFRQELPSAKSRFGILPIPEKDRAPLWEDDPKDRPSPRPDFGRRGAFPLEFEARGPPPRPEFDRRPPPRSEYGEYLGRGNIDYTYGTPPKFGPPYTAGYGNSYNEYGYR